MMLVVVLAVLALYAARLVQVQIIEGPALAQAAQDSRQRTIVLHAERGRILDAEGAVLATSVVRYDIVVDQRQVPAYVQRDDAGEIVGRGAAAAAAQIAPLLGLNANELGATLTGESGYVKIAREVTPAVREAIEAIGVNGLTSERTTVRSYPAGTTAGPLIGWVNEVEAGEVSGASGLEHAVDSALQGTDGERSVEIGVGGTWIPGAAQSITPAQDGADVHTSLVSDIQHQAESSIDAMVAETGAEWGAVVVIEVGTGRILALADSGELDPNDPSGLGAVPSVTNPYEPGSTGKILTVAAALDAGVIEPDSVFTIPDRYTTANGQTFSDFSDHETYDLTVAGILAKSSNTGTVQIGQLMTDEQRVAYMSAFGWTEKSGIELGGESAGVNMDYTTWDGRTKYATMFGQGLQVNLLQNTNVLATLANGGVWNPVHLVDGYSTDSGYTAAEYAESRQAVSEETAAEMVRLLEGVTVAEGATGHQAAIDGFRVAGKTGTAQIMGADGTLSDTVASFVGTVPADDPKIAVGVVIHRPQTGLFGGTIAAPVFHDVAEFALADLGVTPSGEPADLYPLTPGATADAG